MDRIEKILELCRLMQKLEEPTQAARPLIDKSREVDESISDNGEAVRGYEPLLRHNWTSSLLEAVRNSSGCNLTRFLLELPYYKASSESMEEELAALAYHNALYKTAVPIIFGLITGIGLIGNLMVIFVILSKHHMRTTVNLSLLNLAVCDIIFVTICVPFVAYHYAADNWAMGEVMCKLSQFLLHATIYITMYTLVYVSALRYLTIVHGARTHRLRTRQNVVMVIAVIWAVMLSGNIPVLLLYRVKEFRSEDYSGVYKYCGIASKQMGQQIFIAFFLLAYVLPLTLISIMYVSILKFLSRKRKESIRLNVRGSDAHTHSHERAAHATRIVISVVVIFGVCWLPLHLHLLIAYFGIQPQNRAYEIYRFLAHVFAYANSCCNPFIYHYVSQDFRNSFHNIFLKSNCIDSGSRTYNVSVDQEHISLNCIELNSKNNNNSTV